MHIVFSGIEPLKINGRTDYAAFKPPRGYRAMSLAWHFSLHLHLRRIPQRISNNNLFPYICHIAKIAKNPHTYKKKFAQLLF